jgi:hypothetical protein
LNELPRRRGLLRRAGTILLWAVAVLGITVVVNVVGISAAGSIGGWQSWLRGHAIGFFAWRLIVYAATIWGWLWMRKRIRQREGDVAIQRMKSVEIGAIAVIVILEFTHWWQH